MAPPVDGVLSPELRILAEIYSDIISDRTQLVDLDQLADDRRLLAARNAVDRGPDAGGPAEYARTRSGSRCQNGRNRSTS